MEKTGLKSLDVDVIKFILFNNKASIDDLSSCFNVSKANIRNVLLRIEMFVGENNLGTLLKDNNEYFFKDNSLNLNFDYTEFSADNLEKRERIVYILLKLFFQKSINLTKVSYELGISRITLNGDIEFIRNFLNNFNLDLVSLQWKGIFIQGDPLIIEKVSTLFIVKLYLEEYFTCNLKKIVNPFVTELFKNYIDEDTEKKITKLARKIYSYFDIQLGTSYYYVLKSLIIISYYRNKENIDFPQTDTNSNFRFEEKIYEIMSEEEKNLIGNNTILLFSFISYCVYEKYASIYSFSMSNVLKDIFSTFDLDKNEIIANEMAVFINAIYFQGKFLLPSYYTLTKEETEYMETDISKTFMQLLDKYNIPYRKENIAFLYCYLSNLLSESKKKNVLIIDNGSLNWVGKKLKKKIKYLENLNEIDIVSYFYFKLNSEKFYNKNKYDIYVFIDLTSEKNNNYPNKNCIFINSYDLIFNNLDIINLFNI